MTLYPAEIRVFMLTLLYSVHYEFPPSNNIHKSMLLRGVKLPEPTLDAGDLDDTRNRAGRTGRGFGGAPLRDGGRRNGNGYSGYGNGNGYSNQGPPINYANPFAAHLNPSFDPSMLNRAPPPPPHVAAANGWAPPPPPTMQASGSYWNGAGYTAEGGQGWGYRGPPPQAQQGYGQGGNYGGRDSYRGGDGYRRDERDSYRGGGGRDRDYGYGRGSSNGGYHDGYSGGGRRY